MKATIPQFELSACANAFNLVSERGIDGARLIAEKAEAEQREREARVWQEKMQRKLSECPGFVGCEPPSRELAGSVTVQPAAVDEAMDFLKRRCHVGQVAWKKGLGLVVEVLPWRKGLTKAVARRKLARVEQFQFRFEASTHEPTSK
jgi:hypothetical protein